MAIITRKGKALKPEQHSVLIIDDQPFYRNLLGDILRNIGIHNVTLAVDGADGLDAIESVTPTIIICDWVMPEMNGLEFTREVRSSYDEKLRMTPIIMITSNNLRSQIEEARNCGVDTFILKPVSMKAVWDRLKEVVETPREFIVTSSYVGPCRRSRRPSQDYFGPFRRADDPMELNQGLDLEQRAKASMAKITKQLADHALSLHNGDRNAIIEIRKSAQDLMILAQQIADNQLGKVCWSLNTYLEKFAQIGNVRGDIVAAHIESMEVLIKTPCSENSVRDELVRGLHGVVVKAIRAA